MIVVAGFAAPLTPSDAGKHQSVAALRRQLAGGPSLRKLADASQCVTIPAGEALIIIGGRHSIFATLEAMKDKGVKFVTQNGSGLTVTACQAGNKFGASVRFLGRATKIGAAVAIAPTGIVTGYKTATQGGAFGARYLKLMQDSKKILKNPSMVTQNASEVSRSMTIIQLMGGNAGRPDRIAGSGAADLYVNNLFNLLLRDGAIKRGKQKAGNGGGTVNYDGTEDDDEDDDAL